MIRVRYFELRHLDNCVDTFRHHRKAFSLLPLVSTTCSGPKVFVFGTVSAFALLGKIMLKVTIVETRSQRRLILEGALVQPWVEELKRTWAAVVVAPPARQLIVDLNSVTAISKEGEVILSDFVRQGAKFLCAGVFTKYQLKQITRKFQPKLNGPKNHGSSND